MPDDFERMWADLGPVGRSAASGGYFRQPFTGAERECHAWFLDQCAARGLRIERDGNGNTVGWWETPFEPFEPFETVAAQPPQGPTRAAQPPQGPTRAAQPPQGPRGAVLTGSHLDSVLDGGAYDGPLGVVSALAALDLLRERGVTPGRRIGVAVFAEEEGSRFGLACLGSRLATGTTTPEKARELTDPDGIRLEDAMASHGLEPNLGRSDWLADVSCYLELHVEQGRDLVHRDAPVGLASAIWPHGRYRFDFGGEANHAGTTAMTDRHDPMLTYAMTALAAAKQARLSGGRATFGRLDVGPNATNAVPSRVTGWLDARCESDAALAELLAVIEKQASERAERDGTTVAVSAESVTPEVRFDPALIARLAELGGRAEPRPVIPTAAGHDAGVLASAGIPSAMLFVRNPTGVSHSPAESAGIADCLAGVEALADGLQELAG